MSPLLIKSIINISLFVMFALFELITRASDHKKIRSGECGDMREKNTLFKKYNAIPWPRWRVWSEGLLVIAFGISLIVLMAAVRKYDRAGAFYDSSWRMPDVESHMYFDASGCKELQAVYDADPEGFDFDAYRICLVKLGCQDCENAKEAINALDDTFYVLFTTSRVGSAFAERYDITFVPSVIYNGTVVELRGQDAGTDPNFIPEELGGSPGSNNGVQEMLDGLLDNAGGTRTPDPSDPGTAGGIKAMYGDGGQPGDNESPEE